SAFCYSNCSLKCNESVQVISLSGSASNPDKVNAILNKVKGEPEYFEKKAGENRDIVNRLENSIFTKSASDEFDFYARQTYLDNLLRGGVPISIATPKGPFVFYGYARKHGDLERDYNSFKLEPSYYSQGNGAYRDINQNRRNDIFFNADVGDMNILTFMNAIQPDGFNPHLIEGIRLSIENKRGADQILKKRVPSGRDREKIKEFFKNEFTPGSLLFFLEDQKIGDIRSRETLLKEILAVSNREDVVRPGEGYWVDHWTYNTDLFESYLACFPERLEELLFKKRQFTFYDTYLRVMPRSGKYVYVKGKKRQSQAVKEDEEKKKIIEGRSSDKYAVRTKHGKGGVYRTTLIVKLISVLVNKIASLDPFGIGIEMEAGKPGWCDSLNGLPGIFGSSLCEVFELKRLIGFIISSLESLKIEDNFKIHLPYEIYDFLKEIKTLLSENLRLSSTEKDFEYWDESWKRKEAYRDKVWNGFDGREKVITKKELFDALGLFLRKIERAAKKGHSSKGGMTRSYYINEIERFRFADNADKGPNGEGTRSIKALSFKHIPVPLFLEGPVHSMKVMDERQALSLYKAIRKSRIYDRVLGMYKVNEPLQGMPLEIGRSTIFTPGWLENESVWLHMEYKYLLEVLKAGLYSEFFSDLKKCLVAFQNPLRYGRNILENSSFIVSSAYPDKDLHGNGFVARLTGTTTEFLSMWLVICLGENPFALKEGKLEFSPSPIIPQDFFTKKPSNSDFYFRDGSRRRVEFQKDVFAFCLLGGTLTIYHNPKRESTFGSKAVRPTALILKKHGQRDVLLKGGTAPSPYSYKIRDGFYDRIDISLC
ncbi:MAG: hypothetical protein JW800_06095, partial [Candidatus Omnitrophica bacterium]|nr:hypothetical protein [Candidatus Omnitrophota bacterium]